MKTLLKTTTVLALIALTISIQAQSTSGSASESSPQLTSENTNESPVTPTVSPATTKEPKKAKLFGPGVTKIKPSESITSLGVSPWRMILSFGLLIGLLGGFFFCLKRFGGKITGLDPESILRVNTRVQLDSKNSLVLVRLREEELLVGIGPNGPSLLTKIMPIEMEEESGRTDENSDSDAEKDNKVISFDKNLLAQLSVNSEELKTVGDE